jgi:DNA-binding NarL/FixJ family response regulator
MSITVLIAGTYVKQREALRQLLTMEPDMEVVGEAGTAESALVEAQALGPDILLLDVDMAELDWPRLVNLLPLVSGRTRVIVVTMIDSDCYALELFKRGVMGYLLKDSDTDTLLQAIRQVHAGEKVIYAPLAQMTLGNLQGWLADYNMKRLD